MSSSKSSKNSGLESLPGELRNEIYQYLLDPEGNKDKSTPRSDLSLDPHSDTGYTITNSFEIHASILRLNKKIYRESQAYLYEKLGPVMTVRTNFFPYMYNRLYDNQFLAWSAKGDSWENIYGREVHLEVTYEPIDGWKAEAGLGTLVLLGMREINEFARWLYVMHTSQEVSNAELRLNWIFNDGKKSALSRFHVSDHRTNSVRRDILTAFTKLHELNVFHWVENPPVHDYIIDYLTTSNSPIFWNREQAFRSIEVLLHFESEAYSMFQQNDLAGAIRLYEQLPASLLLNQSLIVHDDLQGQWTTLHRLRYIMFYNYILAKTQLWSSSNTLNIPGGFRWQFGFGVSRSRIEMLTNGHEIELFEPEYDIELLDKFRHLRIVVLALKNLCRLTDSSEIRKFEEYMLLNAPRDWQYREKMERTSSILGSYRSRSTEFRAGDKMTLIASLPTKPIQFKLESNVFLSSAIKKERCLLKQLGYQHPLYEELCIPSEEESNPPTPETPQTSFAFSFPQATTSSWPDTANVILSGDGEGEEEEDFFAPFRESIPIDPTTLPVAQEEERRIRAESTSNLLMYPSMLRDYNEILHVHADRVECYERPLDMRIGNSYKAPRWTVMMAYIDLTMESMMT